MIWLNEGPGWVHGYFAAEPDPMLRLAVTAGCV